jgi:hypothetical protein
MQRDHWEVRVSLRFIKAGERDGKEVERSRRFYSKEKRLPERIYQKVSRRLDEISVSEVAKIKEEQGIYVCFGYFYNGKECWNCPKKIECDKVSK